MGILSQFTSIVKLEILLDKVSWVDVHKNMNGENKIFPNCHKLSQNPFVRYSENAEVSKPIFNIYGLISM